MLSIKTILICVTLYVIVSVRAVDDLSETIVTEGAEALLTFRYTSESPVPYKLCIGQREPFYMDGQLLLDNLTPSQQKRFRVQALHTRVHRYTSVQIVIEKVQRTDGGSYTCSFYGDETTPRLKEMALTVNFPPGIADCESMPTETKGWDEIQCAAKGGSPPGIIVCQAFNSEEVPVRQTLLQNATHILNRFLINHKTSVNCCAKNDVNLNDPTCTDFVLKRDGPFDKSTTMPSYKKATNSNINTPIENTDFASTTKSNTHISVHSPNSKTVVAIVIPIVSVIVVGVIIAILCISCRLKGRANPTVDYSEVCQDLPQTIPNAKKEAGHDNYSDEKNEQKSTTKIYDGTLEAKGREPETKSKERLGTELTNTRKPPETQANTKR